MAFAEEGIDWTSVQQDELESLVAPDAEAEVPAEELGVEPEDGAEESSEEPTEELGVDPEGGPLMQGRSLAAPQAATSSSFDPGNIISDYNFFNSWAMTEAEIQSFLDRTIFAPCENSNCLNVLKMNTPNASWSWGTCAPYAGAANESAARIIYKVQRACGLSAKVILVTLQKEQSLITRNGPSNEILRKAMGMGCPDTDVCDSQYYGFFNQVYAAARQIVWYTNPDSSMYKSKKFEVGQVKPVQLHPNAGCGAPGVKIGNVATAALYHYTPYQPNGPALAAGWGSSGDPCSSYGNRNFSLYYNEWFGSPTSSPSPTAQRIAGADRYETAAAISRSSFSGENVVPVVYVATGLNFPDALSAAPAAAAQGGPLLLVRGDMVPAPTMAELKRLAPKRIVLVGSAGIIDEATKNALATVAPVERIAGDDRYETSRKIMERVFPAVTAAYVATGDDFPDALSASAAAGAKKVPVLLVRGTADQADAQTVASLKKVGVTSVKVAGGPTIVTPAILDSLTKSGITSKRLSGVNRYLTAVEINKDAFPKAKVAYIATGASFPDALAGAAAAARENSPLYLTAESCVKPELRADLNAKGVTSLKLLGSPGVMSESIARLAVC
ncbi:hypothetical protein AWU67_01925 [Microterricola viridarii]|uniref:Cell wall binding repeat 2 n=1 Tax=Microterricola viridarii TaxID=412690 RepID=A0A0Y0MCJ2_9MICO|nr:hypothetical protein AWU67_01925 [Microterricola viridarii]